MLRICLYQVWFGRGSRGDVCVPLLEGEKGKRGEGGKRGDYWLPDCQVMSRATDT